MGRRITISIVSLIAVSLSLGILFLGCGPMDLRALVEQRVLGEGEGGVNNPPVIDAGTYPAYVPNGAALSGTVEDPDGEVLTLTWSEVTTYGVVFGDAEAGDSTISYTGWSGGEVVIEVTLKLTASDGTEEVSAEVTIQMYNTDFAYVTPTGGGDGSAPDNTLSEINAAITYASVNAKTAVAIAAGTYSGDSASGALITLVEGISLFGGYSLNPWSRDPSVNTTSIVDNSATGGRVIESPGGITMDTIVDGFTLQATTGGAASYSFGVDIKSNSNPIIRNNTINGGISASNSFGIYIESSSPIIQGNIINGGGTVTAGPSSYGIYSQNSSAIIEGNEIDGGTGGGYSYGIYVNNGSPEIRNNTIAGGSGLTTAYGILCYAASPSTPASPNIRNNTIDGGSGSAANYGINLADESHPRIENNIIFCSANGWGIEEAVATGTPTTVDNNDVFGCANGLYLDIDTPSYNPKDTVVSGNFSQGASYPMTNPVGTGNVSADPFFQDGLHLGPGTQASILTGGIDGAANGWGFNTDKDGNPRTGNGTTGWSMGAYEFDP